MTLLALAPHLAPHADGTVAIGGGGLGILFHLFIWRAIWRLGLAIWHIPTFGPVIIVLLVIAVAVLAVRRSAGLGWPWQRRDSTGRGPAGRDGTGPRSRDWRP